MAYLFTINLCKTKIQVVNSYLIPKQCRKKFLLQSFYLYCCLKFTFLLIGLVMTSGSVMFIPDPGSDFSILDPGARVQKAPDPESPICNKEFKYF